MICHNTEIIIRPVKPLELAFIQSLSKKVFSQYGPYDKILTDWFLSGKVATHVALIDEIPVGFTMVRLTDKEQVNKRVTEILAIAVVPEKQNCGIGNLLMAEVLRLAEKKKVQVLTLCTSIENAPAQALFNKHGFLPLRIEKGYYEGGQEAVTMCRVL